MTSKKAANRAFGIEVECYLPTTAAERSGSHVGGGLQINWAPEGWGGKRDGSLSSQYDGYRPVEIVSPILAGEDGMTQAFYVVETIQMLGGKVDSTCGLHVHVDARDLRASQVQAIKQAFVHYEKAFFGLCGSRATTRMGNCYCKASHLWGNDTGLTGGGSSSDMHDRYRSLNLTNYYNGGKQTVEFRVWFGTLTVEEVVAAVYMAVGLVNDVINERLPEHNERIESFEQAAREFAHNVWLRPENRILPECTISEISRVLYRQAQKADRAR